MPLEVVCTFGKRIKGLLGKASYEGTLVLAPCNSVHTFWMKFDLDVCFADEVGAVLASYRNLPPNCLRSCKRARLVFERQANPAAAWPAKGDRITLNFQIAPLAERRL